MITSASAKGKLWCHGRWVRIGRIKLRWGRRKAGNKAFIGRTFLVKAAITPLLPINP